MNCEEQKARIQSMIGGIRAPLQPTTPFELFCDRNRDDARSVLAAQAPVLVRLVPIVLTRMWSMYEPSEKAQFESIADRINALHAQDTARYRHQLHIVAQLQQHLAQLDV